MVLSLLLSWHLFGQIDDKNYKEFYFLQTKIRESDTSSFFKLILIKGRMKAYIGGTTKDEFFKVFLKKVVTDLETFENLIESDKLEVNLTMTNFKNEQNGVMPNNKKDRINIYKGLVIHFLFIQKTFGKGSYLDLTMSQLKVVPILLLNQYDIEEIIVNDIKRLEGFGWKGSPYLDLFYIE